MDIIAGVITAGLLLLLFSVSKKIKISKPLYTALLSGFVVFAILSGRIIQIEKKIGIILVSFLLIFALNLKIKQQAKAQDGSQVKDRTKHS